MHMAEFYPALQAHNESQGGEKDEQPISDAAAERLSSAIAEARAKEDPKRRKAALAKLTAKAKRRGTPTRANTVRRTPPPHQS